MQRQNCANERSMGTTEICVKQKLKALIILSVYIFADTDECSDLQLNNCASNALCTNTEGSYVCRCFRGYKGDGTNCTGNTSILIFYGVLVLLKFHSTWNAARIWHFSACYGLSQMQMNVLKQMTVMQIPCVPTRKVLMSVGVFEDTLVMGEFVQVHLLVVNFSGFKRPCDGYVSG